MRGFLVLLFAAALTAVTALPADAHAGLMPGQLEPGAAMQAHVVLAHGCGPGGTIPESSESASATRAVTIESPDGLAITAKDVEGWELTAQRDSTGRTTEARWEHNDEAGALEAIRLDVEVDASSMSGESELWLPVVQECVDGEQLRWTHPGVDEGDGRLPAMRLAITEEVSQGPADRPAEGPSTVLITLVVAALAVAGGVGTFVITGRRS